MNLETKNYKLLNIFTGIFVGVLVLVPSMSSKFIAIGPLYIVGSTLIFPITFIFNDIFTEVYGYKLSRKIIWTGMAMQIFAALFYWLIDIWDPAPFFENQEAYSTILGQAPRIVIASLTAYFFGEFANSVILSKLKYKQNGKKGTSQSWRFVLSTLVGEGLDSFVFMLVAFFGVLATEDLFITILTIWGVKVLYEILVLPFSTRFANWVKKVEGIDVIDTPEKVKYNPFSLNK
jgi:hypothetical protein